MMNVVGDMHAKYGMESLQCLFDFTSYKAMQLMQGDMPLCEQVMD